MIKTIKEMIVHNCHRSNRSDIIMALGEETHGRCNLTHQLKITFLSLWVFIMNAYARVNYHPCDHDLWTNYVYIVPQLIDDIGRLLINLIFFTLFSTQLSSFKNHLQYMTFQYFVFKNMMTNYFTRIYKQCL